MHLGNIFSALLAWLSARSQDGRFILRLEDIDPQRSRQEYADKIIDDLRWLGIDWDAQYVQSQRYERYEAALKKLSSRTFPLYRSRKERLAVGAPQDNDSQLLMNDRQYVNEARQQPSGNAEFMISSPTLPARKPATAIKIDGEDIILRRSDGAWAYQLAVVIDDAEMGVTEVVRGRDLEGCVKYHNFLQDVFGYQHPTYIHVPLIQNRAYQRLSKRDKSLDMAHLREMLSPEETIGRMAFYAGIIPEIQPISAERLIPLFSWDKVPKNDITVPDTINSFEL